MLKTKQPSIHPGPGCGFCKHFMDDPENMEAELPGIGILGSMYGSTRGDSGFCRITSRFMSARDFCQSFEPKPSLPPT